MHVEAAPRRSRAARLGAVAARQRVEIEHHAIFGPRTATPTGTARSRCSRRLEVELARGHDRPGDHSAAVARGKDCERGDTGERGGERSQQGVARAEHRAAVAPRACACISHHCLLPRRATRSCPGLIDQSAAVARGKDCERGDTGERGGERSKERHAPSTAPPSLPVPAPASSSLPPRSATRSCQHRTWLRRFGCQGCGRGRGCCSASLKTRV